MENDAVRYAEEAFARNIGILTQEEQEKLRTSTIAIAGLGGVGGAYAQAFARMGIGKFRLADMDTFAVVNINRQFGANRDTFGKSKVEVLRDQVLAINPHAEIQVFDQGFSQENAETFLQGVDLAIDGIDFFGIRARRAYFDEARKRSIPVITAAPIGFGSAAYVFTSEGMSFDEYFDIEDSLDEKEMLFRFGLGLAPAMLQRQYFRPTTIDFDQHAAPSIVSGILLAASLTTTLGAKILLGKPVAIAPHSVHFDPYVEKSRCPYLPWGHRSWVRRLIRAIARQLYLKKGKSMKY
jgi:molybdopterin/thiamine biosynthesis adenylyltransferase